MQTKETFERDRSCGRLLQNMRRHFNQRRSTFGNKRWRKFRTAAINEIKSATLGVENACCAFNNQTMQVRRTNCVAERFPKSVKKIKNERFFDLNFFLRTFQSPNASPLTQQSIDP